MLLIATFLVSSLKVLYISDSEQCSEKQSRESRKRLYCWPPLHDSHPAVSEFLATQLISVWLLEIFNLRSNSKIKLKRN